MAGMRATTRAQDRPASGQQAELARCASHREGHHGSVPVRGSPGLRVPSPASQRSWTTPSTCRSPAVRPQQVQGRPRRRPNTETARRPPPQVKGRPHGGNRHSRNLQGGRQPRFTRCRTFAFGSNPGTGGSTPNLMPTARTSARVLVYAPSRMPRRSVAWSACDQAAFQGAVPGRAFRSLW